MSRRVTSFFGACGLAAAVLLPAAGHAADAVDPAPAKPAAQWPLTYLKADEVWQHTKGGGVTVGLVDSGVSPLGDTRANLLSGADFSEGATSSGIAHIDTDTDSHGTTMAVLIAGTGGGAGLRGLAPEAKILPVRMQKQTGEDPDKITDAIKYATAQHVKVINMSLGTAPTADLAAAVKAAQDADIVVVAAAGNGGTNRVITPASYPGVVAVGAVDETGTRWAYSSYGPQLALMGPGVAVPVEDADGAPKTVRGTSNATAYVTASATLVRAMHPDWTAGQTIRALLATATKAGGTTGLGRNDKYGYGIVNPLAALGVGAPLEKDNPLMSGAAPLAPALSANAPVAAPTTTAAPTPAPSSSASTAPSPSTRASTTSAALQKPVKTSLLSSRRNKILAMCAGAAVLGLLFLLWNGILKRRELRKNRAWH